MAREPFCARYRFIVRYRAFFGFQSTARERSAPKITTQNGGSSQNIPPRAKAKGQSPDGSTRGILKGGIIRAGASYSPLEPASLLTFLPEQESKAPAGSARSQFRTEIFCKSLLPLQSPVSLPCRRLRLYRPPGGRWLGAKPQVGGSQRAHSQLDCQ